MVYMDKVERHLMTEMSMIQNFKELKNEENKDV